MSSGLLQREAALAAVALFSVVLALALGALVGPDEAESGQAVAPQGEADWYQALAAPYTFPPETERTACGQPAGPQILGVAHPVLPCGAKIVLEFEETTVLTQVIDRGAGVPGREFDVTAPLARELGLEGVQPIRWRFAE